MATAIKSYNSEILGILKEHSSNHTQFSDKLEKLSSRVDSIYNSSNECDYVDNQSENSYMSTEHYDQDYENYAYGGDIIQEDNADPHFVEEDSEERLIVPSLRIFLRNLTRKRLLTMTLDSDHKDFRNVTFREGILDDQQTHLVKNIHRPGNMFAIVKTKVNQCIWRFLKPQTQTDDVKMQTIQNDMIKAFINVAKLLNEAGQSLNVDMLNLGTGALALLGQANKLINNKRKESHKKDLDVHYLNLCSANFPFSEWLNGDYVNKQVKDIQDMNKVSRNVGSNQRGGYGHGRGRGGYPRYSTRGRGHPCHGSYKPTDSTYSGLGSKNSKMGFKKLN